MRVTFFLLEASGQRLPKVRRYAYGSADRDGRDVLAVDRRFRPYLRPRPERTLLQSRSMTLCGGLDC
jgi:hypothetical protein